MKPKEQAARVKHYFAVDRAAPGLKLRIPIPPAALVAGRESRPVRRLLHFWKPCLDNKHLHRSLNIDAKAGNLPVALLSRPRGGLGAPEPSPPPCPVFAAMARFRPLPLFARLTGRKPSGGATFGLGGGRWWDSPGRPGARGCELSMISQPTKYPAAIEASRSGYRPMMSGSV